MAHSIHAYTFFLVLAMMLSLLVSLYAWRKRDRPSMLPLMALMLAVFIWCFGYIMEIELQDFNLKVLWAKIQYFGIAFVPFFWFLTALEFTEKSKHLSRVDIPLLLLIPITTIILVFTNEFHNLVWSSLTMKEEGSVTLILFEYGHYFWINMVYAYTLLALGTYLVLQILIRRGSIFQAQAGALLVGVLLPWAANVAFIIDIPLLGSYDPTPIVFSVTGLSISWGLVRYRLFNIVPVAYDTILDNMPNAVVVCDSDHRIVDMNPEAGRLFGKDASKMVGRSLDELIPGQRKIGQKLNSKFEGDIDVILERDKPLHLNIQVTNLRDKVGQVKGHVLIFHDVTTLMMVSKRLRQEHSDLVDRVKATDASLAGTVMALSDEVKARKKTEEEVQKRLRFEKVISSISSHFMGMYEIDEAVDRSLEDMGTFSGASRAYLFLVRDKGKRMDNTHEWCDKGVGSEKDDLQDLPTDAFRWWMGKLNQGEVIHVPNVDELPKEASAEKEILKAQGIRSVLVFPVQRRNELVGYLGFDNIKHSGEWKEDDINILRLSSHIIGAALERQHVDELTKEKARNQIFSFLASAMPVFVSNIPMQAKDMLISTFAKRFEANLKPSFERDMKRLVEAMEVVGMEAHDPAHILQLYLAWVAEFFQMFGVKFDIHQKERTGSITLYSCPWTKETKSNPIYCLMCRAIVYRSYTWTELGGAAQQKTSIAGGDDVCTFNLTS